MDIQARLQMDVRLDELDFFVWDKYFYMITELFPIIVLY